LPFFYLMISRNLPTDFKKRISANL
jgi:hypothetical protein